jgi:NAD+-dependent protein deacetylase sirtuin 5
MPPSTDKEAFQRWLSKSRHLTILTGAGVSAESGIPTFRGAGGLWRTYNAPDLSSPDAWARDPGLVWEFYHFRRELMGSKTPNPAHAAIADVEAKLDAVGAHFHLLTQNIDDLHLAAGSKKVTRLHGSLWQVRCVDCARVTENKDVPITPAFAGSGAPDPDAPARRFALSDLPKCAACQGILRPHVVWFGESLDGADLDAARDAVRACATFLVIGTSAAVWPAAGFIYSARNRGAVVAEVNPEPSEANNVCDFYFQGKAGELLPDLLNVSFEAAPTG